MNEANQLQGTWAVLRHVFNGNTLYEGPALPAERAMVLAGCRYSQRCGGRVVNEAEFEVDAETVPARIEIGWLLPDGTRHVIPGIYRLEGDLLTICIGRERPTEFTSLTGGERALWVYQRV